MAGPLRDTAAIAPRWATPRTPGRRHYGRAVAQVAAAIGRPLQPWQQLVADVATELVEGAEPGDGPAAWAYRTIPVHVQRRAGKTTLVGPVNLHTLLTVQAARCWLTAQTRQDARDAWLEVRDLVAVSPIGELFRQGQQVGRRSNGSEGLQANPTGSTFRVFAPSEDALHGKGSHRVTVDEGWAFDHADGVALQQAIVPTFGTTGGQLWLPSTAGTAASTWYRAYVDRGRAAVESGQRSGIAFFEWSLTPAEADQVATVLTELARRGGRLDDALSRDVDDVVDLVLARHPGQYILRDAVREAALDLPPGEFLRAYGNVWTLTSDRVIADHAWQACRHPQLAAPEPGDLALAFDVAVDRSAAAIAGAWRTADHRPAVDVLDARPGASWLVERIEQLADRWRVDTVGVDAAGPALDVADELQRRGRVKVARFGGRDYVAACAGFLAGVDDQQLQHRGTPALDTAVAAAASRTLGDGWAWSRRTSAGPIAPLVAATVALWTHDHRPAPIPAPAIVARRA